jgi:Na+-translocating ferredoxin:NAD+ oxidoreductase RnfG subunit
MKKALSSAMVLLVLGIICGSLLALVNMITAPVIAQNELEAKMEALKGFFTDELTGDKEIFDVFDVTELNGEGGVKTIYLLEHKTTHAKSAVYNVSAMGWKTAVEMMIAVDDDLTLRGYAFVTNGGTEGIGLTMVGASLDLDLSADLPIADAVKDYDAVGGVSAPVTGSGVKTCFQLVALRVAADLGVE